MNDGLNPFQIAVAKAYEIAISGPIQCFCLFISLGIVGTAAILAVIAVVA